MYSGLDHLGVALTGPPRRRFRRPSCGGDRTLVQRDEDTDADGDCTDDGGSERVYYCDDANHHVTALVEVDGDVAQHYLDDAYGAASAVSLRSAWARTRNKNPFNIRQKTGRHHRED